MIENSHVVIDTSLLILYDKMMTASYFSFNSAKVILRYYKITDEPFEAIMHSLNLRPRKGRVTKHLMRYFLHKLNVKLHEIWNCIYNLNPRFNTPVVLIQLNRELLDFLVRV